MPVEKPMARKVKAKAKSKKSGAMKACAVAKSAMAKAAAVAKAAVAPAMAKAAKVAKAAKPKKPLVNTRKCVHSRAYALAKKQAKIDGIVCCFQISQLACKAGKEAADKWDLENPP